MLIIVAFRVSVELEALLIDDNVVYRPDLDVKGCHALLGMLRSVRPDVLVTRSTPSLDVLSAWRAAVPIEQPLSLIRLDSGLPASSAAGVPIGIALHRVDTSATTQPEIDALQLAEALNVVELEARRRAPAPTDFYRRRVALVGAGIVNLISAYYLVREGYQLDVFESGPDPREPTDWSKHGCTFGGGDARIFSMNEGRHHHHKGFAVSAETNTQFQRLIPDGGWLSRPAQDLGELDRDWIREFERVPQWLSNRYDRDIISFNRESLKLWREMMIESPDLFTDVGFHDGLLRLYATADKLNRARQTEQSIGALQSEIELRTLGQRFPSLAEAIDAGSVAGALAVAGFSLNVHKFGRTLLDYLTGQGVLFHYDTKVTRFLRDEDGRVSSLQFGEQRVSADHYVLSPGAFGNDLLRGFASHQRIAPVVGMWLTLPDRTPKLDRPLKISREGYAANGAAEGANVIAGTDEQGGDVIHISSGHGYIGAAGSVEKAGLADLARSVHETARHFFPSKYRAAMELGLLPEFARYCIRPWTPSGLGLFEVARARDGLAIVTGGHNTGGFAQSPSVAQAVMCALRGKSHPMHSLYQPHRFLDFATRAAHAKAG